jgi:type I restriction enzyme R subunit
MPYNEADTCRICVTPKLQASGWENTPHSLTEQYTFTDGRVEFHGNKTQRGEQKRSDYILRDNRDFPIAVVEAKPESDSVGTGMQQARDYAEILGLKFAYATNGHALQVAPVSDHGNVMEIAGLFGGAIQMKQAADQMQALLYEM